MSVKADINDGKYLPKLPYIGEGPKVGFFKFGDYKHLAIARVEVYPPGYDPFGEHKQGQPKIKPTYEYYLDMLLIGIGSVRYRINVADRKEAETLLAAEETRIKERFSADLFEEYYDIDADSIKQHELFRFAWRERLKGLHAVADRYRELLPLIA
jgi:hypothetical protein